MRAARIIVVISSLFAAARSPAHADGAFPDGMGVLLPADRPHEIVFGTNFGLLITDDDGASWRWVCEQALAPYPSLFQMGAPPTDAIFAVTPLGLLSSSDGACHFAVAQSDGAAVAVVDAFPDPIDPSRVLAIGVRHDDGGTQSMTLIESRDAGLTFGAPLYAAPAGSILTGVEIARADPNVIYLAQLTYEPAQDGGAPTPNPFILRSSDGGATFRSFDASPGVGGQTLRIAAIDPISVDIVYFIAAGAGPESLAISDDGGATLRVAVTHPTKLSAFVRRASGTLILAARDGAIFRSTDGGKSFSTSAGVHLRGLAERDGVLYGAADNFSDGFAVGKSTDDGATWQPLLQLYRICGVLHCPNVEMACQSAWPGLVTLLGIQPAPACFPDGGAQTADLGAPPPPRPCGCCCGIGRRAGSPLLPIVFAAAIAAVRRRSTARVRIAARRDPC